jgi:hypothetical protein
MVSGLRFEPETSQIQGRSVNNFTLIFTGIWVWKMLMKMRYLSFYCLSVSVVCASTVVLMTMFSFSVYFLNKPAKNQSNMCKQNMNLTKYYEHFVFLYAAKSDNRCTNCRKEQ